MKKWYKEPLLHFLIIGAVIFVLFSIVNKEENVFNEHKIIVSTADIERLSSSWSKLWNRPPTETELKELVDAYIKEEVYYREALALGLDQNDTILRRRLMQKMEFLSNDLAELNTPDESTLNNYMLDHLDKYEVPARISFTHIYFSPNKRGDKVLEDAKRVLSDLDAMRAPELGDAIMMEYDFDRETPFVIEGFFGKEFTSQLFALETGKWQGPIESGYGLHLVRISEKVDPRPPELNEVVEEVTVDWMFEQRNILNEEIYEAFKKRYEIIVENLPEQSGIVKTSRLLKESS